MPPEMANVKGSVLKIIYLKTTSIIRIVLYLLNSIQQPRKREGIFSKPLELKFRMFPVLHEAEFTFYLTYLYILTGA